MIKYKGLSSHQISNVFIARKEWKKNTVHVRERKKERKKKKEKKEKKKEREKERKKERDRKKEYEDVVN